MEETEPKKSGRPKADQTRPLIFARALPKVTRELSMEASTALLIEDYASWAAETGGITKDEACVLLIDRSIDAFVRKDRLFNQFIQNRKRKE